MVANFRKTMLLLSVLGQSKTKSLNKPLIIGNKKRFVPMLYLEGLDKNSME